MDSLRLPSTKSLLVGSAFFVAACVGTGILIGRGCKSKAPAEQKQSTPKADTAKNTAIFAPK